MDKKKPKEFSKKIFNIVITLFIVIIFYSMALMWKTENTDGLMYLIPSISGITATTIGFYYWKAKMENIIKISKSNNISIKQVKELESKMSDFDIQDESEVY